MYIAHIWQLARCSLLDNARHQSSGALRFQYVEVVPKSYEQPAYAVVFLEEHQTTVHFHDFLDTYRLPYDKKTEGRPGWE